jgi:hypothetical protein
MAVRKIAISIPEDVLALVDRLAKRTKTTRSGCITRVLSEVARATTQAEITDRINQLFLNPDLAQEQASTARVYLRAAEDDGDEQW